MIQDYDHLPIGKYLQVLELAKTEDNDIAIVEALSGKTADELLNMPIAEYRTLADKAGFLFYKPTPAKVQKVYKVGDYTLCLGRKFEKMTTAQYIDFKEYAKTGETDIARYLSVVLVPEGKAYNDGYDVDEVCEAIRDHLMTPDALGIRDFFVTRLEKLTAASLTFSRMIAARMKDKEKARKMQTEIAKAVGFLTSGDGLQMWTMLRNSRAGLGTQYMR